MSSASPAHGVSFQRNTGSSQKPYPLQSMRSLSDDDGLVRRASPIINSSYYDASEEFTEELILPSGGLKRLHQRNFDRSPGHSGTKRRSLPPAGPANVVSRIASSPVTITAEEVPPRREQRHTPEGRRLSFGV